GSTEMRLSGEEIRENFFLRSSRRSAQLDRLVARGGRGEACGLLPSKVGTEGEVDQVGKKVAQLRWLSGDDRPGHQRDDAAENRVLCAGGQRLGRRRVLAAPGEDGNAGEDRLAKAHRDRRGRTHRLQQAETSKFGLGGEELERGAKARDHLVGPVLLI